ncbi:protein translocase subunit SecD [Horticoccus luteus]|uniref:Multifunctional fusion protein n=1 Tax=Horticoccus luteus TaxID=2862869 RepID=A0A8F9XMM9_9BACT|nr:protein translocase subunit SecD [Horticoccus luteus]QYM80426.1 protein translocase subunit SecD [Horticoccus luteus]
MLKRNLWKIVLSVVITAWALTTLLPMKDQDFAKYAKAQAGAKPAEFAKLVDEAVALRESGQAPSDYVALRQIARARRIDLSVYFPQFKLEETLKNVEKRDDLVLHELDRMRKSKLHKGLDLAGGVAVTLEIDERAATADNPDVRKEKISKAIDIIDKRINEFGVSEPLIRAVGDNRIEIQLPGINTKDNPEIVDLIKKPALLDFRVVNPNVTPGPGVDAPPGYQEMTLDNEDRRGETSSEQLFVKRIPEMTGKAIANSFVRADMYGKPEVILQFTKEGKKQFADITRTIAESGQKAGRLGRLAIVLDGQLYSAPTVREEIDSDSAEITGTFSDREALNLANVLNNPLDLPLVVKEQYEVGPSLAAGAISSGKRATVIGVALVAAFMISYYTLSGLIAVLSVTLNILIVLGVLASFGATLTMPGIAGIVLTVGMAVDAHILIFERMREELRAGKSLPAAFHAGHDKAFTTIIDANLTTLITSLLMVAFGNGPVKGFGITITIGIFSTMFTALIVSEMLLDFSIGSQLMKRMITLNLPAPKINFVKYGRRAFTASWVLVLVGVAALFYQGHKVYGIDFAGGDVMTLSFKQHVDIAKLQAAADSAKIGEVMPVYHSEIGGGLETLNVQTESGKGEAAVKAFQAAFPNAGYDLVGQTAIGPSIGKEIQWNALMAIGLSIIGIMVYVAFRFEIGYGFGAVVSTVHDVLMTVGIFVLVGRQFTAPMVGAILLIVGYSINDTIVVFDRIREELKQNPNLNLRDVINLATNRVFTRSILTSLTTFLAALALFIFGGGVINDLAFTFLVGIVTGTFSSIFIASPLFYWWHKGDRKHVEAHHDIAPKYEWAGSSRASD